MLFIEIVLFTSCALAGAAHARAAAAAHTSIRTAAPAASCCGRDSGGHCRSRKIEPDLKKGWRSSPSHATFS